MVPAAERSKLRRTTPISDPVVGVRRPLAPRAMPATSTRAKAVCCLSGLCGASAALLSPQAVNAPSGARGGRVALCAVEEEVEAVPTFDIKTLAGATAPLGFWDPLGLSDVSEGRALFYREVEIKHGRVAMLATVGFALAEQWHPLFGGNVDVPSYIAFQQTPLQTAWKSVLLLISLVELGSIATFDKPLNFSGWWAMLTDNKGPRVETAPFSIRGDREPGDLDFDPLGLTPTDPTELKDMQSKELNHGRLAMIAIAGMVGQELATGQKLF